MFWTVLQVVVSLAVIYVCALVVLGVFTILCEEVPKRLRGWK